MKLIKIRYGFSNWGLDIIQYSIIDNERFAELEKARDLGIKIYVSDIAGKYSEHEIKFDNEFWRYYVEIVEDTYEIRKFESMFPFGICNYDLFEDVLITLEEYQEENK